MSRRSHLAFTVLALLVVAPLAAQTGLPAPETQAEAGDGPTLEQLRADAEEARQAILRRLSEVGEDEALPPSIEQTLRERLELLERLEFSLTQRGLEEERADEAAEQLQRIAEERAALNETSREGVIALPEVDALRERRKAQGARARAAQRASEAITASVEQARGQLEAAGRARSEARTRLDEIGTGPEAATLAEELETARVRERLRRAELELRRAEQDALEAELDLQTARDDLLGERLEATRGRTVFTPEQLLERLASLEAAELALKERGEEVRALLPEAERRWTQARQAREAGPAGDLALTERELAARVALEQLRRELRSLTEQRSRIELRREAWKRRHALLTESASTSDLGDWLDRSRGTLEELEGQEAVAESGLAELRRRRAEVESRIQALEAEGGSRRALSAARARRGSLDELVRNAESELQDIETTARLLSLLVEDLRRDEGAHSWFDGAWERTRSVVSSAWSFEITTFDERQVTVGGLVKGLLVLLVGLVLVRLAWAWLGDVLERRLRLDQGAAATLETIAFYLTAVVIAVLALHVANIPLTAFTLLGGALAIGVGFGTQNLMSNFISGLLLLIERPVRVGDLIEMPGGTRGIIRRIGARSTKVRTGEGVDILVPNSLLLENEVVNWTLSDDAIRTHVAVGVAYGSPTRDVARILKDVADNHGRVLANPDPFVLFSEFGDNALAFELHCWVRVRKPMDALRIQSDLRFMIDSRFRDAGIVIAFPQRDVHLDLSEPLAVRMTPSSDAPEDDATP